MSEPTNTPMASQPAAHDHPVEFKSYVRTCAIVLSVVLVAVGCMIWTSYLPQEHFSWTAKVWIILGIASCNAFFVAGFLMHLLSEKKMVYTILGFTVSFVIGLFGLTIWAMNDFPKGTFVH